MVTREHAEPVDALRNLLRAGQNYRQVLAAAAGVGVTETHALTTLQVLGRQSQTALAANLGLTPAATTSVVDRLESAGLARRTEDPADRRRWMIELDDRGRRILADSRRRMATAFDAVPRSEWAELTRLLDVIAGGLDQAAEQLGNS
ncbi:DNA-binding MarR family transcriptional regulator [Friedmanniella endophytica]|uniref:DNA-binding MarR family transcriptional regulator n=1 Tax=Microlunatus kandeliicorticis TaxID=1759536 RepID=A0A7W3P655_9ACTN|nr:MarR family transcriptional regulator [Microlunatus kandeliicorticis]MBA8794607.1 DNA-binding MarR family transcriptional regulator [Microlunatus kandeliicorticis]